MTFKIIRSKASTGSKTLAGALRCKRNKLGSWPPRLFQNDKIIINWGSSQPIESWDNGRRVLLNKPSAVSLACDKLKTFRKLLPHVDINIPRVWTPDNFQEAQQLLDDSTTPILLARSLLSGHSGAGITVLRRGERIPQDAKIVVEYIKKKSEYRAHVVNGEVILLIQKKKRNGVEQTRDQALIRSHDNGWIFACNDVETPPETLKPMCIKAVAALGLDFGAVDVIVAQDDSVFILEVNTAPGLEGETTINAYRDAFQRMVA
jgi:glutathione synthase/RimK-type ligase-like ATP-grasp enzyme